LKNKTPFTIYNASAGSGKTFTLVKEYLTTLLQTKTVDYYKNLLAITFTNKAVGEMKQRIIENLVDFSDPRSIEVPPTMMQLIASDIKISISELHERSKKIIKHLLHHYAFFSVETIDHFNHRLIRTFARDLKLPPNFEVSLDTNILLTEAVDLLISKAGKDEEITRILLNFALEKVDEDASWDIARDILAVSKLLTNENDAKHLAKLKGKSIQEFLDFRKTLQQKRSKTITEISSEAQRVLNRIGSENIPDDAFTRQTLPNHFKKLVEGEYNVYKNKLQENLELGGNALYKKTTDPSISSAIDNLMPFLLNKYLDIKQKVFSLQLLDGIIKNLIPLSVVHLVAQELETIKEEKQLLPINEFNALIHSEIKNQPAPFIYERLGERYRHFFIDEFQDTSYLQWQNLIPLIDNSLSQQFEDGLQGSVLLVGDAKQSIYRWRGGLPEQFMDLYGGQQPFSISEKMVANLDTNYRSFSEIINFNNRFFSFIANHFENSSHQSLYTLGNAQKQTTKEGGYVSIEFIEKGNKEENTIAYSELVTKTIQNLLEQGFEQGDICILTRKKSQGVAIGTHLIKQNYQIVSEEMLLLQSAPLVDFIVNVLQLSMQPGNQEIKFDILTFLHQHLQIEVALHDFYTSFFSSSELIFEKQLETHSIEFSFSTLDALPLYESCEYIIRQFSLNKDPNGYLFGFMDLVYDYLQSFEVSKVGFLVHWEQQKEKAAVASNAANAISIMTIHKAKGLEFPVVLFPFADEKLYEERDAKTWYPWEDETSTFNEVLIPYKNDVANYGEAGASIYLERRSTLELDAINLLYVTLTRAVEQLFVFSELPGKTMPTPRSFNELLVSYLNHLGRWDQNNMHYSFGTPLKKIQAETKKNVSNYSSTFNSSSLDSRNLRITSRDAALWNTEAGTAIETGNLLHDAMSEIHTTDDIEPYFIDLKQRNVLPIEVLEDLERSILAIVNHQELIPIYNGSEKSMTEREIITHHGTLLRPDRLNFHGENQVRIIDYKTGREDNRYESQLDAYQNALQEMGYRVSEKIIIYSHDGDIMVNKF